MFFSTAKIFEIEREFFSDQISFSESLLARLTCVHRCTGLASWFSLFVLIFQESPLFHKKDFVNTSKKCRNEEKYICVNNFRRKLNKLKTLLCFCEKWNMKKALSFDKSWSFDSWKKLPFRNHHGEKTFARKWK